MPASEGQSGCGTKLQTVGVLCFSKYPVMNIQREREKRHTVKKGERRRLIKETDQKTEKNMSNETVLLLFSV